VPGGQFSAKGLEFGDVDFDDFATLDGDHLIALGLAVGEAEMGLFLIKEDGFDDPGLLEEFKGPVDGGLGNMHFSFSEFEKEFVRLEYAIKLDDGVQYLGAFSCEFVALFFEMRSKDRAQRHVYRGVGLFLLGLAWGHGWGILGG
jgi:hypothetical protein